MDDARNVAEEGQEDVEPELASELNGEEDTNWRQKDREEDTEKIAHQGSVN
jgi:hypothetical protein